MATLKHVMIVETQNLSCHFGGLCAVDQVNLGVDTGEVHAIIGPNGAGKTTLVSLISGRLAPTTGNVRFQGNDITRLPAWRRVRLGIAYTFQITSIYPSLSLYENVAIAAQMKSLQSERSSRKELVGNIDGIISDSMQRAGLNIDPDQPAGEIAYGHQRLLEIAMGLALDPKLLILDEPTQGLSDGEIQEFIALVNGLRQQCTVLLIEHNVPVVTALADRITVLDQGRVLAQGSPAEISGNETVQDAYLGR